MTSPTLRTGPFKHYAWVILAVAFVGLLGAQGVRLAFGAFVLPWEEEFTVNRGTVTTISLVSYLIYGIAQPTIGKVIDRFRIPRLFAFGLVLTAVGLVLSSLAQNTTQLLAAFGIVASIGIGIAASVTASVLVARWFVARRGLAFGILEAGFGAGQLILAPFAIFAISAWGWRATLIGFAALLALVLAPLSLVFLKNRPSDVGLEPLGGFDHEEADDDGEGDFGLLRRKEFWYLGVPFFVCGITTTGMIDTHLIAFAHDHGNSDAITSTAVGALALFNILGTAVAGYMVDSYDPRRMLGWLYALRAVSLVMVLGLNEGFWLIQFGVFFGIVDFATVAPTQTLVTRYFGPRSLGFVFGLVLASHQVGSALGSYIPGVLYDATGSYTSSFLGATATLVVASVLSFRLPPPGGKRREPAAPENILVS